MLKFADEIILLQFISMQNQMNNFIDIIIADNFLASILPFIISSFNLSEY
jgi:hypothetical protein